MANYEIMLVVSGSLDENGAKKVANEISSSIKDCKPKVYEYGSKQLAYRIKKDTTGYYFQYNFECEEPAKIFEFRRLSTINKFVLRTLIINLEKDYGYRASVNPKKIEKNKKTAEIHAKRKAEIEKNKAAREAEKLGLTSNLEVETTKKVTKSKKTTANQEVDLGDKKDDSSEVTKTKKESSKTSNKKESSTTTKRKTTTTTKTKAKKSAE